VNGYLLDTNVISEVRVERPHGRLLAWLNALADQQLFLSAVMIGELQVGVEKTRRQDPVKASEIEAWIEQALVMFQVLPMDAVYFREWARLRDRKSEGLFVDAMIAATARVHRLIVATRNERDFARFDVRLVNPFKN
jgi:predicted nucleic acid-binding protein